MSAKKLKDQSRIGSAIKGNANISEYNKHIVLSLHDLDETQGQTINEWHDCNLLTKFFNTIKNYSKLCMNEALNKNFKNMEIFQMTNPTTEQRGIVVL